jgi:hypothetical protein
MVELKLVKELVNVNDKNHLRDVYEIGDYEVYEDRYTYKDGRMGLHVSTRIKMDAKPYTPDIYYDCGWGKQEAKFQIQTTSYGPLGIEELEKFITAQQEAIEIARILTEKFINTDNNDNK